MAKPFLELREELRERLLRAGVAPRHVRRYLTELSDHRADLKAEEERAGLSAAEAEAAALARLGSKDDLAKAMIEQRQFQSWAACAPWATFGLAPIVVLALAWIFALFLLWSGWQIFLPGADTPFIRINGLAIAYFGVGRLIYFGAPILIGWAIGLSAARQRLKTAWPLVGLVLISLLGGTAQVHANRIAALGGARRVGIGFTFASAVQGHPYGLLHALVILSLTALPYLVWRLHNARLLRA